MWIEFEYVRYRKSVGTSHLFEKSYKNTCTKEEDAKMPDALKDSNLRARALRGPKKIPREGNFSRFSFAPNRTFAKYEFLRYNPGTPTKEDYIMERKKKLRLTGFQCRLLINALLRFRNHVSAEGKPTEDINDLILLVINDAKLSGR